MYVVIMAGGGGTRLWPLSTPERPKPFLPLVGEQTLLQRTVARLDGIVDRGDIFVVVAKRYGSLVREQLPEVRVILEPSGRNTAAAIALATVAIDRPPSEVMAVLPADHTIEQEALFRDVLAGAAEHLATGAFGIEDPLVTLGIRPDRPATEYGYLRPDLDRRGDLNGLQTYPLLGFEEKPGETRAKELFAMSGTAWNAGMFLWRRRAIRAALERFTPLMTLLEPAASSELALSMAYDRMSGLSIDVAVMEGAAQDGRVVMAAMDVGWSDLGSWTQLLEAIRIDGARGTVVASGVSASVAADDLVVRRIDGRLELETGPREGILDATGPSALLSGARADRAAIEALLARCSPQESRS
jgi:mannose-1-phosphate guanylyltransferase